MDFYTALSTYYDEIFEVSAHDMHFINSLIPNNGRVLDIGCGTGNKTVFLANAASIEAIDLDPGMIAYAKKHHAQPHINYTQMDMRNIWSYFGTHIKTTQQNKKLFNAILCLGNTLVHLPEAELWTMLQDARNLLERQGAAVIQILNYDRILDNKVESLPVLETQNTVFTRNYHWNGQDMHFVTSIIIKATGQKLENDIILYPLRTQTLTNILTAAGFSRINWYGSFAGAPFTRDSFVSIAHCLA